MSKYAGIIAKLEAATGPDRELDHLIHDTLVEPIGTRIYAPANPDHPRTFICSDVVAPSYTASIDAALELVERMLPDAGNSSIKNDGIFEAYIWNAGFKDAVGFHKVRPIAILLALFRALETQEQAE